MGIVAKPSSRARSPLREALLVNILEEPIKPLQIDEKGRVRLAFTPFQVLTLKLIA